MINLIRQGIDVRKAAERIAAPRVRHMTREEAGSSRLLINVSKR